MQELLKMAEVELLGEVVNRNWFLSEWERYLKVSFFFYR